MAEAMFKGMVSRRNPDGRWRIDSAGIGAYDGLPASEYARQVMQKRGLPLDSHRSQFTSEDLTSSFNLILTMEKEQRDILRTLYPQIAGRIFMLSEMIGKEEDVEDPIGGRLEDYEYAADRIEAYLEDGFQTIWRLASNEQT